MPPGGRNMPIVNPRFLLGAASTKITHLSLVLGVLNHMTSFPLNLCVNMPREWRDIFCVSVQGQALKWSTLPFGWKYSPVLCQRLMAAIMGNAVADLPAMPFVYIDDVLVASNKRELRRAVGRMKAKLHKATFVLSPKLETTPVVELDFIGKIFNMETRVMRNRKGMIMGLISAWFKLVRGRPRRKGMERFLGRLEALSWDGGLLGRGMAYKWKMSEWEVGPFCADQAAVDSNCVCYPSSSSSCSHPVSPRTASYAFS